MVSIKVLIVECLPEIQGLDRSKETESREAILMQLDWKVQYLGRKVLLFFDNVQRVFKNIAM